MLDGACISAEKVANYKPSGASPLRPIAEAEDVVDVLEFFLSDLAMYIKGAVLPVDGGTRAAFVKKSFTGLLGPASAHLTKLATRSKTMARIPYLPADLAEPQGITDEIRNRRGGNLNRVDRLLLYSPTLAQAWNQYAGTIRSKLNVNARYRELAILVVSALMETVHELNVHGVNFRQAGGTDAQFEAICRFDGDEVDSALFDEAERSVIALCLEMTRSIRVSDATFEKIVCCMDGLQGALELIATVATYNMTNRVLMALEFEPDDQAVA